MDSLVEDLGRPKLSAVSACSLGRFWRKDFSIDDAPTICIIRRYCRLEPEQAAARTESSSSGVEFRSLRCVPVADPPADRPILIEASFVLIGFPNGIATRLMNALMSHLQASGVKQISGSVLANNSAMLTFIKQMGFAVAGVPDDPSTVLVTKHLD
jgi:hypothetical protein